MTRAVATGAYPAVYGNDDASSATPMPVTPDPSTIPLTDTVPPHDTTSGKTRSVIPVGDRSVVKFACPLRRSPAAFDATTRQ